MKIFYAIKFIVRPLAISDQVVIDAAEAATREIVRHQKGHSIHITTEERRDEAGVAQSIL